MDIIVERIGVYSGALEWADKVARVLIALEGGLVTGPPGVGKSYLTKKLQALLKTRGEKFKTCAYTHAVARLVGGKTVAHLLQFDKMLHGQWVLIDEISLMPIDTLGQIARWQMVGAKFVLFGEFEGKFEAFIDRWKEVSYADVPRSQLLMDMCSRTRFHMDVYRRGDDQALYDWYTSLY